MRKTLAFCLAVLLALAGAAHAEPAGEPLAPEENYVLVARLEADGTYSYALLGAGDGAEAFAAFGGEGATYEERFALFQEAIAALEPAVSVEGGEDVLTFALGFGADGSAVQVSLGSEALATLAGKAAFAIVTGSFASGSPVLTGECEVYIWGLGGILKFVSGAAEGEPQSLCPNCGGIDDGSAEHDEVISEFCKEGHTKCMGDPEHICDADGGCGKTYPCSKSNSHTKCIKCGELWCYKAHGDHKELACGHRGCEVYGEEEKHEKCDACGKYLCNGKSHKPAACGVAGHFKCDGQDHSKLPCGHFACQGGDHSMLPCGHYACEGGNHTLALCGIHYVCEGGSNHYPCIYCHGPLCDGQSHGIGHCVTIPMP